MDVNEVSASLMQAMENMKPLVEAAQGQRRALEEAGWSPTAAEQYALELLLGLTRAVFK